MTFPVIEHCADLTIATVFTYTFLTERLLVASSEEKRLKSKPWLGGFALLGLGVPAAVCFVISTKVDMRSACV